MAKMTLFSDKWFEMVEKANNTVGELPLSPTMKSIGFNVSILKDDDKSAKESIKNSSIQDSQITKPTVNEQRHDMAHEICAVKIAQGKLYRGKDESVPSTVTLTLSTLKKLLATMKGSDAIEAFINGDIQIHGDISQMMALQMAKLTEEQKTLYSVIIEHTQL